ncbi:MAG: glycosyltransferase family 4 protein [Granulosicoccaceae bacterium]
MHIAMVTPFPVAKPKGGVEAAAVNLVRQLVALGGHRITILAPSYRGDSRLEEREGFCVQWVPQPPLGFLSYWSVFRLRVHHKLAELEPDICHFQAMLALSNNYSGPYVGTVHGLGEQDIRTRGGRFAELRARIVSSVEGLARRNLSDCIVINPYVADMLGNQLDKVVLHYIGNPLDEAFFEEIESVSRTNDFLFVAKMDRNKNLGAAIEAFALAKEKLPNDARLVVYGPVADQNYHQECLDLIEQSGLAQSVEFAGAQPPSKIAEHMRRARALLLTSHHEVAPMVISEALSCGLPSITYRKCGMQYMIEDGVTGVLAEDGDVQALAKGMQFVVTAEGIEERCRRAGQVYSPKQVAAKTLAVYQQVVGVYQSKTG